MSDLNPTLTEFDKSVVTTDVLPEMKPFSVWTDENNVADNEPQSYVQYTDYLRESYLDGGSYNIDAERELRGALNGKLQEFYGEDQEAIAQATAIKEIPFEEKVGYLYAQLDSSDPDAAILGSYRGGQAVIDSGSQPITEEYQQKIDGLREQAEQIVGNRFDLVKRNLVDSGQIPLAYVTNDDGDQELIAGDAANNLSITQAIKASKIGGVHMADALLAQTMLSPVGGTELPLYKFRRIKEISKGIATLAKADSAVAEHIEGHARGLARTNNGEGMVSGFFEAVSDFTGDLLNAVGVGDDESNDRRNRVLQNSRQTQESFILSLTYKLNEAGGNYSQDDVRSAYEYKVVEHGVGNGSFELHQDAKDAGKNLFKTSLGPLLNPKVFTREGDLEKTLAAHPDLSEEQKTAFMGGREDFLRQNFSHFSKTISESAVGDEWVAALVEGRQAGKDDLEIFDKFVEVDDNYNEFAAGAKGVAWSIIEPFESLFYLAPAMFGNDWAKNGLADQSERQSKRREIAEIFGEQYGLFRDVTESIAPMAVDVAATVLLSIPTAGAGGAAYLTIKSGANLTAKGLAKALTSNVLRASTKEGYKAVADKAAGKLIKESLESGGRAETIAAIKAFNNQTAQKFGITAASFVSATTRSSAMSYGSLYSQFRNDPNMTEEQAHDRALGFALSSGVITGVITAGFSSIGRGGVETALLRGASFNQVKNTLKALSNTSGISDKTVADVIAKVSSDSIKKLGKPSSIAKRVGRGAVDEGFEEAVDQFVNSFVEDIALDQNTPMLERMKQVWHSAQVGGLLGGGVPALQAVGSKLKVTPMDGRIQAARAEEQFYIDLEESLKSTGSPLSAGQLKILIGTRARGAEQKTFEPSPDQSTGPTSEISRRETDLKIKELTQSETALSQELEGLNDVTIPSGDDTLSLSPEASRKAAIISKLEVVRQSLDQENNLRETLDSPTIEIAVESSEGDLEPEALLRLMNDVSPLDVEAAFNNQLQINLGSSENVDTIVFLDDSVQPANAALSVDYTNQQMRSSSVGVDSLSESKSHTAAENAKSSQVASEGSKSYSTRPTPTTVSFAESPFTGLNSEERTTRFYQYAQETGFPVNVRRNASYGLPLPEKSGPTRWSTSDRAMSDLVNSAIYSIYPVSEPPAMMKVTPYLSKQASKTYFDPKSGKTTLQKVKGHIDKNGNGVFNNDPVVMADMIQSGLEIKVPRDFNRSKLNPSIRIKDGFVVDVVGPVADGSGVLESKTTSLKQVSPIEPNTLMALIISRIPFKKASSLPAGVKDFNPLNGGPLAEDFSDTTGIKLRIKQYELEIAKTGSELNRLAQDRLISDSGELSTEYKLAALEDAKQRFLFNAQLFGLRDKLIREPSSIKKEIISQTNSRSLDEAAQRLIPFVSLKGNAQLDSDSILDLFIDQKLQNNPDFANNTPPTFDSLLTKSVRVFKSQNEAADTLNKARAANTLPSDMTPESFENERVMNFVANFGLNPVGDLAPAEVINSSVSKAMGDAIEAINTDSSLRRTVNRITLESIINDSPEANKLVENASARDIFGIFTSWMASGNANARQSVNDLMVSLANGEYVSGDALEQALLLTALSNRADGAGYENSDAVAQYRDILSSASGREISMDEARNTMISMSKAVRVHLSRSNVAESQRQSIETQNYADIQRLGLKSGDPKSVVAALKQIAKDSDVPSHKIVADLLLQDEAFVGRVNFVIAEGRADIAGKYIKQQDGGHSVYINPTTGNGRGLVNTLLEEYVHAFTSDTLNTPREQLKKSRRGVLSVLTQLQTVLANARSAYKNQVAPSGGNAVLENALIDVEEFLPQFLLASDVQKFVKALVPPKGATPFFERFINKIVRLFPNVSSSEAKVYTDALMDVLDIGNNSYKTTTTDAKAFGSSTARKALASAPVKDTGDSALDEDLSARKKLEEDAVKDAAINAEAQAETDKLEQYISSLPEADRVGAREAISLVQNLSPVGLKVAIDPNSPFPAYVREDSATIFINPKLLADRVRGVDALSKRMLIGGVVHEEVAHTASFNALSDAEIQRYINELSDADYVDIAESYYVNSPENLLKESLERLRSEDPKVVADEKFALAEEKLRMHLQKVTRGFTTEDDVLFWKSNPSLLAILKRYFTGIINRWAVNKKRLGGVGDATFNKILVEMRAIEAGFMRQPRKMAFNPEFPISSFMMFEKANQDYTGLALAASITSDEYPESAEFPTSAFNTLHGGMEIPSGLSDNNAVAAYLREMAVEFWGVEVNEDGGKPKGDEETFLTPITAKSITEEQEAKIVSIALQEVSQALAARGENAGNWYTTAIEAAMAVASVVYPELANSQLAKDIKAFSDAKNPQQAADLIMKLSLAITSQNLKVSQNTVAADAQYKLFRETGKFDDSIVYGSKGAAIQSNLTLANLLIEKLGFDESIEFIESDFTVKSLNKTLKDMGFKGIKVAGLANTEVQGAAIFGPKIGQGFLQNLRASVMKEDGKGYIPVTVDLWLRRTWGRWTGDSAGKGLTTSLAAEFLTVAKKTKSMPAVTEVLIKKVADTYAQIDLEVASAKADIDLEDASAKADATHISRAKVALGEARSLRVNSTGKDLTKGSAKKLIDNRDIQIALFSMGKFVNSRGEAAYKRTREPFPPKIIENIREGNFDPLEIYTYLEKRNAKFESIYRSELSVKGVPKAQIKLQFLKDFDGSEEVMEAIEVRDLKLPWQNVAKRVKESIKPIDSPTNLEREVISRVINKVRIELESRGMTTTNADIQAILWYPEKDIWQKLQGGDASNLKQSYDEAYLELAKNLDPETYEKAIKERNRVLNRGRDRAARNSVAPQQGADGRVNREAVGESDSTQARGRSLAAAPVGRPALDAPYLAAVESGDMDAAQAMVDEAAKAAGYVSEKVYHGSWQNDIITNRKGRSEKAKPFNVFKMAKRGSTNNVLNRLGFFFTPNQQIAEQYSYTAGARKVGGEPRVISAYLSGRFKEVPFEEASQMNQWRFDKSKYKTKKDAVAAAEKLKADAIAEGFDGLRLMLERGGVTEPVEIIAFSPNQIKSADPVTKDENGNVIPLSQRFDARSDRILSAAPVGGGGVGGSKPTGTNIDHSQMVELLEIPVYELESDKPSNFITDFLYRLFAGEVSEPFRRLIENRDAYKRATEKNVAAYKKTLDELIEKTYGGIENANTDMLAKAQGYQSGDLVSSEVLNDIDAKYEALVSDIEKDRKAKKIDKSEAKSRKALAINKRDAEIEKVNKDAADAAKADRDNALREIARDSPELAAHIIDIREELIIPLQKKLIEADLDSKIGIKISNTGGIYVTRSYRMFTDSSYYAEISESKDQKYVDLRNEAISYFEDQFLKDTKAKLVAGGMESSKAEVKAKEDLDSRGDWGQQTLNTFLIQYKDGGRDSTTSGPRDYKLIADNLKRRKDLPEEIRKLLGEYDAESGTDLILRTYSTVAMLASQQAFLTQLRFYGKKSNLLVSEEEYRATEESRRKYDEAGFVQAREGGAIHGISDPLAGMRIHPEFKRDLDKTLKDSYILDNADTAQKAVEGVFGVVANLSGKSMALKTLGSIGFYFRNALGNLLFGAAQGYFRFDKILASMRRESIKAITGNLDNLEPELAELVGLNVVGDELRAGVIRDLLNGRANPEGISKQIAKLADKTYLSKIGKSVAWAEKKAQDLSAAVDAGYKIVYYQHELGILREAQAADPNGMGRMKDREIKRLAARKVVMTAQAHSQAPPAVQAWTKSPLGLVFAPFIRFKVEVPRIVINTFKLANEEIKTDNPVLVRRGRYRRYSMMTMLGGVSSAVPMILATMAGIGDDEDEAIRLSIPDYLRGHSFYYFGKGENLKSVDLTYLNPFALMADPFLRAYENLSRGEYSKAGASLALGIIKDQYLDDQILAGAVLDAWRNVNPSTGKPIWNAGSDSPLEVMTKTLGYVAKEAYAPRIGKDIAEGWATGTLSGMRGEILEGARPFRIHDVDLQKQYQRYLLDLNKRYTNVKGELGQLMNSDPMSDGDVRGIIDENIEDRTLLNRELLRINKGFSGLGLSDTDLLRTMKDKGVGKNRIMLLSRGYMDRPSVKYIMENLLEERNKEYGPERAQKILDYYQNLNRYLPVVPIDGPE